MQPWQIDPWRWSDRATILRCRPLDATGAPTRFAVRTTPTVLYPEGGGQPADRGSLGGASVLDVQQDDEGVVVTVDRPLVEGEAVDVRVDGARRFDHMQQHTGQHLLTAILHHRFGLETTSFHLGAAHAAIELAADGLDDATRQAVSEAVNAEIRAARPVTWRSLPDGDLAEAGVRSRHLPSDLDGPLRLVEIEGVDLNTCCGTHVSNTAQLQAIHLGGVRSIGRRGIRLDFLVGGRVLRALETARGQQAALSDRLSTGPADHDAAVARLQQAVREAERRVGEQQQALAAARAASLVASGEPVVGWLDPAARMPAVQALVAAVVARSPDTLALGVGDGVFALAGPPAVVDAAGPWVAERLGGRGGGARGRYQGRCEPPTSLDAVLAGLRDRIR